MVLASIESSTLAIPFKAAFGHAKAVRHATQTVWVEARADDGTVGWGEGCPREYVTAETLATAHAFIAEHRREWCDHIHDLDTLDRWRRCRQTEIDANPAAWSAVELALLDLLGRQRGQSVEALLGLPELAGSFAYTAVLGDLPFQQFEVQLRGYLEAGFRDFKVKLAGDRARDRARLEAVERAGIAAGAIRADANNLWDEPAAAISYLKRLAFPLHALEEPLRAGDYDGMRRIASVLPTRIILDESLVRREQLQSLRASADAWIVNVRISKMGGLLRSLELVSEARERGLRVVVGAHVGETSLLTRAALTVANCSRDLLFAQEGAFGIHLLARDMVQPPIMFGRGGRLDAAALPSSPGGFSLTVLGGP